MRRAAVVPVALALLALAGCSDGAGDAGNVVIATNEGGRDRFDPASLSVTAGSTVTFRGERGLHTVDFVETDGLSAPHGGNLDPGQGHHVRFDLPGTYPYYCQYHSSGDGAARTGMVGTVTVQ